MVLTASVRNHCYACCEYTALKQHETWLSMIRKQAAHSTFTLFVLGAVPSCNTGAKPWLLKSKPKQDEVHHRPVMVVECIFSSYLISASLQP